MPEIPPHLNSSITIIVIRERIVIKVLNRAAVVNAQQLNSQSCPRRVRDTIAVRFGVAPQLYEVLELIMLRWKKLVFAILVVSFGFVGFGTSNVQAQQSDQAQPAPQTPAATDGTSSAASNSSTATNSASATQQSSASASSASPAQTTQNTTTQNTTTHIQPGQTAKPQTMQEKNGGSNERILWSMPNFLSVEEGSYTGPITAGQKFKLVTRSSFDPAEFVWYGLLAGISQAQNSEAGYGQGAQGYAKRYGSQFGDGVIESYMVEAIFPVVFRQDPRYFRSGQGGVWRREGKVLKRLVVTKGDNGNSQFNISEIGGAGAAAAISTYSYHPSNEHDFGDVASTWGTQIAFDGLEMTFKEFWPDIRRKLHHENATATQP
jgi:hypothetical protein